MNDTATAHVEYDPMMRGVRAVVLRPNPGGPTIARTWGESGSVRLEEGVSTDAASNVWLRLEDDEARSLYEALGEYFGGNPNDTRLLRRDLDAERKRVDLFIAHLTTAQRPKES